MGAKHAKTPTNHGRKTGMLTKAKLLEIVGFALLLGSYIAQNFFYDKWQEREQKLEEAIMGESLIDKSNLIYIAMYNITDACEDSLHYKEKMFYLRQAALKLYQSKQGVYGCYDTTLEAKQAAIDKLERLQAKVPAVLSYESFVDSVNLMDKDIGNIRKELDAINSNKPCWRFGFLFLYIAGAFSLFLGLLTEYRHYKSSGE